MKEPLNCPNCKTKLKGLMSSTRILSKSEISFIQTFSNFKEEILCEKCGKKHLVQAKNNFSKEQKIIKGQIRKYYSSFPIVTIQPPLNWKFQVLGLVSAQTTMDNRVQNKSILDSLLGLNENLVDLDTSANSGEVRCMELLRQKTYAQGGNAIVGVDIDYAEFGLKGELMLICMAGTAINIQNHDAINTTSVHAKIEFQKFTERIKLSSKFRRFKS